MSRYETVALKPAVAQRARTLADKLGVPIGALVATLIDDAFRREFGDIPGAVTKDGDQLLITLGEAKIAIPVREAASVATTIAEAASPDERYRANMNLDVPCMLFVMRKGSGVIFEAQTQELAKVRHTMGTHEAKALAKEIESFA